MPNNLYFKKIEDDHPDFRGLNRKWACLMNVRWQQLRLQMKPHWYAELGGKLSDNLDLCAVYVAGMARNNRGKIGRFRVLHLLDGVLVGYRARGIPENDPRYAKIKSIRNWIASYAQGQYNSGTYTPDTDEKIRSDWADLKQELKTALWQDLEARAKNTRSPQYKELRHFMRVLGGPIG